MKTNYLFFAIISYSVTIFTAIAECSENGKPIIREEAKVIVDGIEEKWRLEWIKPPVPVCGPEDDYWMIEQAYELSALRTKIFGFKWHVDHIIPLRGRNVSGLHVPLNLQVIPGVINQTKSNKLLQE